MKPLALCLVCSLSVSAVCADNPADQQIAEVKADFVGKSLRDLNADLARIRPARVNASDKNILLRDLPLISRSNRIVDRQQLDRLRTRLEAVLTLHDRSGVVDLILFRDSRPIIYNKPGVVVVLSTEILKIVGDNDAALVGLVAHELAHEYVAMLFLSGLKATDNAKLRRLELFCDAIAVVTLVNLHLPAANYSKALERICTYSNAAAELNDGSGSHPALAVRLMLIAEVEAQFEQPVARSPVGN